MASPLTTQTHPLFFLLEKGKNIRAAPFDWRRGPLEFIKYDFPRLKQLVEETYTANNNSPIAFVSLSMGGPYFLSFLNNFVSQEWKVPYRIPPLASLFLNFSSIKG